MRHFIGLLLFSLLFFLGKIIAGEGENIWTSGKFKVGVEGNKIVVLNGDKRITVISSIEFNFTKPTSITLKGSTAEKLNLELQYPSVAKYREEGKPLFAQVEISVSNNTIKFFSDPKWAEHVTINMEDKGEHFFGILEPLYPNNRKSPDLRGEVVDVDIEGHGDQYYENYADAWSAFFMTDKGYASFFDTFAKGKYKLGINNETWLYHHTGKLEWYIFVGNNGDEILKEYYGIIGKPKYIPMWACGTMAWRDENKGGKEEILSDIQKMTELQIPFTAWFVDRPYSNGSNEWSKMDFNNKFSNPKEWIEEIKNKYGMEFMSWVGPMTFDDKDFPGLLPNFRGYMDLTNPDGIKEFRKRLNEFQYSAGVRGHKMDRAEEQFPEMSPWYDKTPEAERRNKYIYLYAKTINSFLKEKYGTDQFNFARGAFHRCQPYLSAIWGGDSRSSWDGLAGSVANSMRCGFMGFPVWGSDGGGYLGGRISEELYARWLEFGSWSGLFETKLDNAGGKGEDRPPWKYSEKLIYIFRNCASFRMDMEPFIYSLVNTSYKTGVLMKPLAYMFPEDKNTYDIWNEYMFGNTFLVAPITDTTSTRKIYLPKGIWSDFYNRSLKYEGEREISVTAPLDHIPVFVKSNSFYLTGRMLDGNSKLWKHGGNDKKLNIYAFPGEKGETVKFNYVDYLDNNKEKDFVMTNGNNIIEITSPLLTTETVYVIKMEVGPKEVTVNGEKIKWEWDNAYGTVIINLKEGHGNKIQIIF
jgi:alpha-glucosidase (family GH31 glycosyl hydrolase)